MLVDALAIDINRGQSANFLTRQAAENIIPPRKWQNCNYIQLTETLASINFAPRTAQCFTAKQHVPAQTIDDITRATPGRVTTTGNLGWSDRNIVLFRNIGGMTEIEGKNSISKISDDTFELYEDTAFEIPWILVHLQVIHQ